MAVYQWSGLNGKEWPALRKGLKNQELNMFIIKNTLARKALSKTKYRNLHTLFNGNTSIIYSDTKDVSHLSTAMASLGPLSSKLVFLGAKIDGALLSKDSLSEYLALKPVGEYHSEILGLLSAPPAYLVSTLEQNQQLLVHALDTHAKSESSSSSSSSESGNNNDASKQ